MIVCFDLLLYNHLNLKKNHVIGLMLDFTKKKNQILLFEKIEKEMTKFETKKKWEVFFQNCFE